MSWIWLSVKVILIGAGSPDHHGFVVCREQVPGSLIGLPACKQFRKE